MPFSSPLSLEERRAFAQRHVDWGRLLIARQREIVDRHKAEGRDPTGAQKLLDVLERTQKVFERDLTRFLGGKLLEAEVRAALTEIGQFNKDE
jgi:hypothetical protein